MRKMIRVGLVCVALAVTAGAARAQVGVYRGYNPFTGRVNTTAVGRNPFTGTVGAKNTSYNPWTGRVTTNRTAYNPYTGAGYRTGSTYNPLTGRAGVYAYGRRW